MLETKRLMAEKWKETIKKVDHKNQGKSLAKIQKINIINLKEKTNVVEGVTPN